MSAENVLDVRVASVRAQTYGRLAQAFTYPEKGRESLLTAPDYTEAFDPAASADACSLREYSYNKDIHPTSLNEELLRFYHFFGLKRSEQALMPDHLAVELEFMQFLNLHEMNAASRGEDVAPLQRAQRDFLDRHLSVLAGGVNASLRTGNPACLALVELVSQYVSHDLHRLLEDVGLPNGAAA